MWAFGQSAHPGLAARLPWQWFGVVNRSRLLRVQQHESDFLLQCDALAAQRGLHPKSRFLASPKRWAATSTVATCRLWAWAPGARRPRTVGQWSRFLLHGCPRICGTCSHVHTSPPLHWVCAWHAQLQSIACASGSRGCCAVCWRRGGVHPAVVASGLRGARDSRQCYSGFWVGCLALGSAGGMMRLNSWHIFSHHEAASASHQVRSVRSDMAGPDLMGCNLGYKLHCMRTVGTPCARWELGPHAHGWGWDSNTFVI